MKVKERSLLFDNIKTVLIILVVLGHAIVVQLSRQKFKHFIMNRYL